MDINRYLAFGIIITTIAWLMLLFGTAIDSNIGSRAYGLETFGRGVPVYNLQLGAIAQQLAHFGYTLMIIGTLVSGFQWLKPEPIKPGSTVPPELRNASPLRDFAKAARAKKAENQQEG